MYRTLYMFIKRLFFYFPTAYGYFYHGNQKSCFCLSMTLNTKSIGCVLADFSFWCMILYIINCVWLLTTSTLFNRLIQFERNFLLIYVDLLSVICRFTKYILNLFHLLMVWYDDKFTLLFSYSKQQSYLFCKKHFRTPCIP